MNIEVFGNTFFLSRQLIRLVLFLLVVVFGTVAVLSDVRAGNRRRAMVSALILLTLLLAGVIQRWLPFALQAWSVLVLEFGASVGFGTYGWMKLRRESLAMTPAVRYFAAGLLGSLVLLNLTVLLPRPFTPVLGLTSLLAFAAAAAGGAWLVKNRPSTLTDGLWTGGLLLYFSVMCLLLGFLTAYVYASRGWLAL